MIIDRKLRRDNCLDYWHFGDSLSDLSAFADQFVDSRTIDTRTIQDILESQSLPTPRLTAIRDVLGFMSASHHGRISLSKLRRTLADSRHWRARFQALRCRGFSFRFSANPGFRSSCFRRDITLKFALLAGPNLYYPPLVRCALEQLDEQPSSQHVVRAIGWMLGQERSVEGQKSWYIVNVQSDLTSHHVSCVREIFRGWQRVLFWLVLKIARRRGVKVIALPRAEALENYYGDGDREGRRQDAWWPLYDGVASFFNMRRVHTDSLINLQPMTFLPNKWCSTFYAGNVADLSVDADCRASSTSPTGSIVQESEKVCIGR